MPYTNVNDIGDLDDIYAFIETRKALPRAMTRARKANDGNKATDVAETLAAIIDAELAIDTLGRSSYWLLTNTLKISSSEADFIEWIFDQNLDPPHYSILEEALEAYRD